ncbi:hypothetical protein LT336_00756 [Spiroplasma sp. JKS002671]|uniref:hypothetical protein n=1 Tax=Spiroplasma attinicola TaxID=2904537 RepID=UPI002022B50D|nr:hypothetical protein [Spiroplasma sp. JKS002671]MCL8211004.1 hypothetical protein [Spiroplasma sp. JKS002671]
MKNTILIMLLKICKVILHTITLGIPHLINSINRTIVALGGEAKVPINIKNQIANKGK